MDFAVEWSRASLARHGVWTGEPAAPVPGRRTLVQLLEAAYHAAAMTDGGAVEPVEVTAQRGFAAPAERLPHLDRLQALFGRHDLSGVQAHVGGAAAEAAGEMGARAYAMGGSVAFACTPDLHTAAHEAAHVIQQRGGLQLAGGVGRPGDAHERHADAVADLVMQGRSAEGLLDQYAGSPGRPQIQHRTIDPAVYVAYDAKGVRGSTRALLAAAEAEDLLAKRVTKVQELDRELAQHASKVYVAKMAQVAREACVQERDRALLGPGKVAALIDAAVVAFQQAIAAPASAPPKATRGSGATAKERLKNLAAQRGDPDAAAMASVKDLRAHVEHEVRMADHAIEALTRVLEPVRRANKLQREYASTYRRNAQALSQAKHENLDERAREVGVPPSSHGEAFDKASAHASNHAWSEAASASKEGRKQLDAFRVRIEGEERIKQDYEDAARRLVEVSRLHAEFCDLRLDPSELDALQADADAARKHYVAGAWSEALLGANEVLDKLAPFRLLADEVKSYAVGDNPKLNPFKRFEIQQRLTQHGQQPSNARIVATLRATYEHQCTLKRQIWLQYLGIAGSNWDGDAHDHVTTFNNAVCMFDSLSVAAGTPAELCERLFAVTPSTRQIHATRADPAQPARRYHLYWDGTYSQNVHDDDLEAMQPALWGDLHHRHAQMRKAMVELVTAAQTAHGRIKPYEQGREVVVAG